MDAELKSIRVSLYEKFDAIKSPIDYYKFQVELAAAIIESEKNISSNNDKDAWQFHLDRLYALGDALAWIILDDFVIRQLGRYEAVRTPLLSQQDVFLNLLTEYKDKASTAFYIFSDLTRCITIGDVLKVITHDRVQIIESKSSKPASISELLSGRNGRQFSKAYWLSRFLNSGFEKLYREKKPTKTVEVDIQPTHHFGVIIELINESLKNRTSFRQMDDGVVYMAQNLDEEQNQDVLRQMSRLEWRQPVLASTGRLVEEDTETRYHMPAMAFPIPLKYKILIQEVDFQINGFLDISQLERAARERGYVFSYDNGKHLTMSKDGIDFKFHVRFLNNILIGFWSIQTFIDTLIALFEQMIIIDGKLTDEEQSHLNSRPNSLSEFKSYLEENYVQVLFDDNKNIVKAYRMNGDEIDLQKIKSELDSKATDQG